MAGTQSKGVEFSGTPRAVLVLALLILLAGAAPGRATPPDFALLPTSAELAPYRLNGTAPEEVPTVVRVRAACDATPVGGVVQRLNPQLLPGAAVKNKSVGRITLYRFDTPANSSRFVDCLAKLINESTDIYQRAAPYGERGFMGELSPGAPRGASILFQKGDLVVSVDAVDSDFETAAAQGLARLLEQKVNAPPVRTPGFEAVAALGALGAAALALRRRTS